VANLGRPQALAWAMQVREQAAQKLGDWSHARFQNESGQIDRLLEHGDLSVAYTAAQQLLTQCLAAGELVFPEAAYDIAHAHLKLGRVLQRGGAAEAALAPLAEAQRRFQELADAGDPDAAHMAAVAFTEIGDCLAALGRLKEAAGAYEERIRRARGLGDHRGAAVAKFQLGTVRLLQMRFKEALDIYAEARDAFEALGEPRQVAKAWHQIGRVHEAAGQVEPAEQAYRQSLAIKVRESDFAGQASSLNQLGNLYKAMDRLEEAVTFFRQAAEVYVHLKDLANEGRARGNLAGTLITLRRYDEARQDLQQVIECFTPYGHAAEPWKAWSLLEDLERATGHSEAAQAARRQAMETYVAYRRAGGVSQSNQAQLFEVVTQAIQQNAEAEATRQLNQLLEPDVPSWLTALVRQLLAVLAGERDPALAENPELDFMNAAELQLLLEALGEGSGPAPG
jgi:tetratricopeptide (TPR) repeat protein